MNSETDFDVLVVDDDPANCLLLKKVLEHQGSRVATAGRVEEARILLDRHLPGVLVLDLFLPRVSGFTLLYELRRDYDLGRTRVVIYTAQEIDRSEKEFYEKKFSCRILEKLRDQGTLLSLVRSGQKGED